MPDKINIPDQEDIQVNNERLTAENQRLTAELTAATELLETAQHQSTEATQRAEDPAGKVNRLETTRGHYPRSFTSCGPRTSPWLRA